MKRKFLAVVLSAALACNMTGVTAAAQPVMAISPVIEGIKGLFKSGGDEEAAKDTQDASGSAQEASGKKEEEKVILDIGQGDIIISKNGVAAFDTSGVPVTKASSQYIVTGSTQEHAVVVEDGVNANIVLSNVNITRTAEGVSPIRISDDSRGNVQLFLEGNNVLQGGPGAAGIQKNCMHTGRCSCGTLVINCKNTESGHTCDDRCGTLTATGSSGAAGIGGGTGMGSANISIKGGLVTANGGVGGASGGLGSKMNVAGGIVNAGSMNGKEDGGNMMNGNTLLFADSTTGLQMNKGILYQNGAGTVYGNVTLSQGMADHLPTDSTLTIPEGASLTIDEATVLPNEGNIVGAERIIRKKSKTPTPTPEEETVEPEQRAALAAEEGASEPQAGAAMVYGTSGVALTILRNGSTLTNGAEVPYGSRVTLQAIVTRNTDSTSHNATDNTDPNGKVEFYIGADRSRIATVAVPTSTGTEPVTYDVDLTQKNIANLSVGGLNNFSAKYTGSSAFGDSDENAAASNASITLTRGTLSTVFSGTSWSPKAIAGLTVGEGIDLEQDSFKNTTVKNAANETVEGTWRWGDTDGDGTSDSSEILYPSSTERPPSYTLEYVLSGEDINRYNPYTITVTPDITVPEKEDIIEVTSQQGKHGDWYNIASGTITASGTREGYQLLEGEDPVSVNGWENAVWRNEITIDDDFYNGNYPIYVKNGSTQEINRTYIRDFKVDKLYPMIENSYQCTVGGTVAYLTFAAENENSESGIKSFTCQSQQRRTDTGTFSEPLGKDGTINGPSSTTGEFTFNGLSPNTEYDVYVTAEDNAGNVARYLKRIIGDDAEFYGNKKTPGSKYESISGDAAPADLYYGYEFTTDRPDIMGSVEMSATDSEGNAKRGEVAYQDIITATPHITNANAGTTRYSWWRQSPDSRTPTQITDAADTNTYTVRAEDIGYYIICRVNATNTSMLGYLQGDLGPVQRGVCPADLTPQNGIVDDIHDTFTFTGLYPTEYEYCTDGGKSDQWMNVPDSGGSNTYVISVGDVTVLAGNLLVRAKESDLYRPSDTLANEENFISTGELEINLTGEARYGEVLTAEINSEAIDPSDITYEWSYADGSGGKIDNVGNTYEIQKGDIRRIIQVKAVLEGFAEVNNSATAGPVRPRAVDAVVEVVAKEYDGTTAAEAAVTFPRMINGDDLSGTVTVEFADKNAGEDKQMKVSNLKITGADQACYSVSLPSNSDVKGIIRPKQLTLNMTAEDKVYDGTTEAVVNFTSVALAGDSVEVSGTGEFADKNVGTSKTVTSKDVVVTGTDAANYTAVGSTATATASITPKDISIEGITVADKVFDNTTEAVIAVTFVGAMDEVSYTYKADFESASVGMDKRVTGTVTLSGDSVKNYVLANGDVVGSGNIVKALAPYEESNIPQNLTGVEGKKLSSVFIGSGFSWKEPNTVMETVGRHTYDALYNPDPSQYGDRSVRVEVLVQCAKHTWGDWSTTVEPTKEELGERQRICSVCGYIEVETVPRAPYITTEDTKVGWGDIIQAINNASSGTEIPVTMNGTETLPASVQDALQGRDVSLVLQMADGITWTLRGQDITGSVLKDINLAVSLYTDNIPTDVLDPYLTGGKSAVQVHLAYSGEFGFTATLRIPLANEFAGVNSNFYYYNPNRERLEQMDSNRITSDGIGRYDLTHASDYVVILDAQSNNGGGSVSENSPTPTPPTASPSPGGSNNGGGSATGTNPSGNRTATATGTGSAGTTSGNNARLVSINAAKTSDETPVMGYMTLMLLGAAGAAAIGIYRRGRRKERG